jgi:hypothetical protein
MFLITEQEVESEGGLPMFFLKEAADFEHPKQTNGFSLSLKHNGFVAHLERTFHLDI